MTKSRSEKHSGTAKLADMNRQKENHPTWWSGDCSMKMPPELWKGYVQGSSTLLLTFKETKLAKQQSSLFYMLMHTFQELVMMKLGRNGNT